MAKIIPSLGLRLARAAIRALDLHDQSYDEKKGTYTSDKEDCAMQACREDGMTTGEWFIISLAMQLDNDIQDWHKHLEENPGSNYEEDVDYQDVEIGEEDVDYQDVDYQDVDELANPAGLERKRVVGKLPEPRGSTLRKTTNETGNTVSPSHG
jgi:hypothetical protein